ncbi:TetR/AcrR family transcriptional regulator [Lacticaseibacillus daqingensis]|uniref:TetR/AcrR family transcriptional regulator n=1 Tax=Lacticaseibacillus daqingensis TaxID=2486014 RepID=UPI000F799897|nr:TetR/AcrR family transcriptional regulator [Lacticaseibacillus daqingensis]
MNSADLRVVKTQQAISAAFFAELAITPFDQITVTSLTRRALIGKATFYNHYIDKYQLATALIEKAVDALRPMLGQAVQPTPHPVTPLPTDLLHQLRLLATIHAPEADFETISRWRTAHYYQTRLVAQTPALQHPATVARYLAAAAIAILTTYLADSTATDQAVLLAGLQELVHLTTQA